MELSNSMISNIALNLIGQMVQNGGIEGLTGEENSNNIGAQNNNENENILGLFDQEYEAEDIYGAVGQMAGYAYGGVAGGFIGRIIGRLAGGIIQDVKEEILGEDSPYMQFEQRTTNIAGGILSLISGNMNIEEEMGGSAINSRFSTLLA